MASMTRCRGGGASPLMEARNARPPSECPRTAYGSPVRANCSSPHRTRARMPSKVSIAEALDPMALLPEEPRETGERERGPSHPVDQQQPHLSSTPATRQTPGLSLYGARRLLEASLDSEPNRRTCPSGSMTCIS